MKSKSQDFHLGGFNIIILKTEAVKASRKFSFKTKSKGEKGHTTVSSNPASSSYETKLHERTTTMTGKEKIRDQNIKSHPIPPKKLVCHSHKW